MWAYSLVKSHFSLILWHKPKILYKKQNSFSWRDQQQRPQNAVQPPHRKCGFKSQVQSKQGKELCLTPHVRQQSIEANAWYMWWGDKVGRTLLLPLWLYLCKVWSGRHVTKVSVGLSPISKLNWETNLACKCQAAQRC